jgi:serine phosphatase RsbU (regulator of sigma subunit)
MRPSDSSSSWPRLSGVCAWSALALGALTLIGWTTGFEALASMRAKYIPMAPSTALAFTILSAAILVQKGAWRGRHAFTLGGAALVGLLAVAKLLEFFLDQSFGLEELLVADPALFGSVQKGRMSPISAANFLVAALGVACLIRSPWNPWAGVAAALVQLSGMVIVLGYVFGTPLLYGATIIPVALPTAAAFLCLGASLMFASGPAHWPLRPWVSDSTQAMLLRWFLPLMVGGTLVSGYVLTKLLDQSEINPALVSASTTLALAFVFSAIISQVARIIGGRIDRAESERAAAQAELQALNAQLEQRIADRTAELRLKNAQMHEELAMARELQMAMLPKNFPCLPGSATPAESALRFFTFYFPTGDVSGDFFNVFPISDHRVGVVICDVMGHGVRAALVTSMVRALMEQHSGATSDPGELLMRINLGLVSILKHTGLTVFVTALVLIADTEAMEFSYANAGHPRPLHVRRQLGETQSLHGPHGPALGLFDSAKYQSSRMPMAPGDLVILYTDGLFEVEGPNADLYTQRDLQAAVHKRSGTAPAQLFESLLAEIRAFARRTEFDDDVCIVGVEVAREGAGGT